MVCKQSQSSPKDKNTCFRHFRAKVQKVLCRVVRRWISTDFDGFRRTSPQGHFFHSDHSERTILPYGLLWEQNLCFPKGQEHLILPMINTAMPNSWPQMLLQKVHAGKQVAKPASLLIPAES